MESIVIDLSKPETRQMATWLSLAWGAAFGLTAYNVATDLREILSKRQPRKAQGERRFIEPCADSMHTYEEGVCAICKAEEPLSTK